MQPAQVDDSHDRRVWKHRPQIRSGYFENDSLRTLRITIRDLKITTENCSTKRLLLTKDTMQFKIDA
jgi:hypothetical protein